MNANGRSHDRASELAARAIDLPLDAAERQELERHLATCAVCAQRVATMRDHAAVLATPFAPLPPRRVDDAVLATIAARPARSQRVLLLVAAAALLLLALLGVAAAGSFILRNWPTPPVVVVPTPPIAVVHESPSAPPSVSPPPTTPTRSPSPTSTPGGVAWRWQQAVESGGVDAIGPDGTVYVQGKSAACEVALHAFDATGNERSGWPYCVDGTAIDSVAVDAAGIAYLQAGWPGGLVGIRPDGTVGAGWPQDFGFLVGTRDSGIVLLAPRSSAKAPLSELRAYDAEGRGIPGWPVTIPGEIIEPARVGPDSSVAVLYRDLATDQRSVVLIEPDGSTRSGWPVRVPAKMDGVSVAIETITHDGRIVLGSHEPFPADWPAPAEVAAALPSQVAVITSDGTIPAGWPVRFDRPLSTVAEGPDGVLYAVAGDVHYSYSGRTWAGGPYEVIALRADGSPAPGWPVRLPAGMTPQAEDRSAGPAPWAQPPVVGDDGRVVVATGCIDPRDGIVLVDADGVIAGTFLLSARDRIGSGPPAAPGGPSIAPILVGGRTLLAISPGQGSTALDDDTTARPGSIPAALVGSGSSAKDAILAIDASGAPVTGWPLAVPGGGWVTGMRLLPDETLVVLATVDDASKVLVVDPSATGTGR